MAREKGVSLEGLEPSPVCGSCGQESAVCNCRSERRQERINAKRGKDRKKERKNQTEKDEEGCGSGCGGSCSNGDLQTRFGELQLDF